MDGGPIASSYIDDAVKNKTLKLFIQGPDFLYRKDIKRLLLDDGCILEKEILCIYKERKAKEWFVVLENMDAVKHCLSRNYLKLNDNTRIYIEKLTRQRVVLKVHWLPAYIKNELLADFFSQFGTVEKVVNIWNVDTKCDSGMREVLLCTDDELKHRIPHTVKFDRGICMLITCPGRLPLCLRCHCLGHVRQECPNAAVMPGGVSYAAALRRRSSPRGDDGRMAPPRGGDDASAPPRGGDTRKAPPGGRDGVSDPPRGGDGGTAPPRGGDGVSAPPRGEEGVVALPRGGDGGSAPPRGGDGIAAPPRGGEVVQSSPRGEDVPVLLATSTPSREGEGQVHVPVTPTRGDESLESSPRGDEVIASRDQVETAVDGEAVADPDTLLSYRGLGYANMDLDQISSPDKSTIVDTSMQPVDYVSWSHEMDEMDEMVREVDTPIYVNSESDSSSNPEPEGQVGTKSKRAKRKRDKKAAKKSRKMEMSLPLLSSPDRMEVFETPETERPGTPEPQAPP